MEETVFAQLDAPRYRSGRAVRVPARHGTEELELVLVHLATPDQPAFAAVHALGFERGEYVHSTIVRQSVVLRELDDAEPEGPEGVL